MSTEYQDDTKDFSVVPPSSLHSMAPRKRERLSELMQTANLDVDDAYGCDKSVAETTYSTSSYVSFFADKTPEIFSSCLSVGSGYFSLDLDGTVMFTSSPTGRGGKSIHGTLDDEFSCCRTTNQTYTPTSRLRPMAFTSPILRPHSPTKIVLSPDKRKVFSRSTACFLRTADLNLARTNPPEVITITTEEEEKQRAHYHFPSDMAPPGVRYDPNECWIAIDDGYGDLTPIAASAIDALVHKCLYELAMKESIWVLEKKPGKITPGMLHDWKLKGPLQSSSIPLKGSGAEKEVLVWTGILNPNQFGSDCPPVRAEGIINMSPKKLFDILLDSSLVHEYNKTSLGRKDLLILKSDVGTEDSSSGYITKVVNSMNKVPLLPKSLEFVTLLHGRELECGSGYVLVSRAVSRYEDAKFKKEGVLRGEIVSGVNLILKIDKDPTRCVMITVSHLRSPLVPIVIAKRVGVSAAQQFVHDIRNLSV